MTDLLRWDADHHIVETEPRTSILTGHTRTELLRAWNRDGQIVYMARSNASREAATRFTGPLRASVLVRRSGRTVMETAA